MAALFLTKLQTDPHLFVYVVVTVVLSITVHELAHGYAALRLGDPTPERSGHWTWNPIVHMGPTSLVMLLLFGIAFGAMPVDPTRLRGKHAEVVVALAGPLSNLALALLGASGLAAWQLAVDGQAATLLQENLRQFVFVFSVINLTLAAFNMIPLPPFDGAHVLAGLVPAYGRWLRANADPRLLLGALLLVFVGLSQLEGGVTGPASAGVGAYLEWIYGLAGR
ncbi:MAG: site-2 protease family protein [Planctomycetota bacterium]